MKKLLWGVTLTVFAALLCTPAHAGPVTYTYGGNLFTNFHFEGCTSGGGVCAISGSFTVSSALGDNFNGYVTPTSFAFTDGSNFVTSTDVNLAYASFYIVTNGSGAITTWNVSVSDSLFVGSTNLLTLATSNTFDNTFDSSSGYYSAYAYNEGHPGTWTESGATPTPEPSSLLLLGTGLIGLGPFIRRRFARS